GEAVLYGTSAVDITDEVIQKLNQDAKETSPSQTERGETLRSEEKPADRVKDSEPSPSQEALGQAKESSAQTKPLATKKPSSETQSKPKRPVDRQPD
ncbi:MAG: hypothetical protein N2Z21_11025, partial [Candidatus Sumerlaeaceae bacterium]|nr:hypothetical protein [Candidatus Sumerlaeaceae bacterium]